MGHHVGVPLRNLRWKSHGSEVGRREGITRHRIVCHQHHEAPYSLPSASRGTIYFAISIMRHPIVCHQHHEASYSLPSAS
eukprot:1161336-Pelagomonas_calceolata.AAC.9